MNQHSTSPIQPFLHRLLLRSGLSAKEQRAVLSLTGETERWTAHRDIVAPGQTVNAACLVTRGLVGRYDIMVDGQRQVTSFYIAGDMCDLHSVVVPKASWSITAICDCTVLRVPHSQLRDLCLEYPAVSMAFWRDGTVDASIFAKWVGNLGRKNSKARIAHLICEMGTRIEAAGLGTREAFELPLTQQQLADATGMTSVHVNRMLQELRGDGLLAFSNGHIEIENWETLAGVAEFDPVYLLLDAAPQRLTRLDADVRQPPMH